jgi:L-threonylcarbamoyladenylate synthase
VESTVLDVEARRILRPGGVSREALEALIGPLETASDVTYGGATPSPGLLKSHYAPRKELSIHRAEAMRRLSFFADSAYIFFDRPLFKAFAEHNSLSSDRNYANIFVLSEHGSLNEAAASLFDTLHLIDASPAVRIHAARVSEAGLGAAINDRLLRAASGKPDSGATGL